jgi:hypothetical protein
MRRNALVGAANTGAYDLLERFLLRPDDSALADLAKELLASR